MPLLRRLAAVEQVWVPVLEVRVREDTVQEEQHRSGKDKIVQASPGRTAEGINTLQSSFIYRQ
jgi:hypothetical protein